MSLRKSTIAAIGLLSFVAFTGASCPQAANVTTQLQAICQAAAPLVQQLQAAPSTSAAVNSIAPYLTASCNADGSVASALGANTTTTTPAWLETVIQGVELAAQVAPIVLPLL